MNSFGKIGIALATTGAVFLAGCSEEKPREDKLTEEYSKEISKDSLEKLFAETLYDIERNLELIQEKEGILVIGPGTPLENGITLKEKIIRNIQMMNSLMEENKKKLEELESNLRGSKNENSNLRKLTERTREKLQQYEQELALIKQELEQKEFQLEDLSVQMGEMQLIAHMLEDMLDKSEKERYTAYYTCGNFKDLEKSGVLTKTGGFMKLGRTTSLNSGFDEKKFTEINILKTQFIPVHSKKAKLITDHPADSYRFNKEGDEIASLEINDPETFWKVSKYLVLETK